MRPLPLCILYMWHLCTPWHARLPLHSTTMWQPLLTSYCTFHVLSNLPCCEQFVPFWHIGTCAYTVCLHKHNTTCVRQRIWKWLCVGRKTCYSNITSSNVTAVRMAQYGNWNICLFYSISCSAIQWPNRFHPCWSVISWFWDDVTDEQPGTVHCLTVSNHEEDSNESLHQLQD